MDSKFFQQLDSDRWEMRVEAAHQIEQLIKNETDLSSLLKIRTRFEERYREEKASACIYTPEILYLREVFAERCLEVRTHISEIVAILLQYVSDVLPDTYPHPIFGQQGPEWVAPSKWKVRIQAARALGVLGDRSAITVLTDAFKREWVKPVRRMLALSISALKSAQQDVLLAYYAAYGVRDQSKALAAIKRLLSAESDAMIRQELLDIVEEIRDS